MIRPGPLLLLACALAGTALRAEPDSPPTPAQMLALARGGLVLPPRVAWTAEKIAGGTDSAATSIASTRDGNVQRDVISWSGGGTSEAWRIGPDYLAEDPRSGQVLFQLSPWPAGQFDWACWISASNLRGLETFDGKPAIAFADTRLLVPYWPGYLSVDPDQEKGNRLAVAAYFSPQDGTPLGVRLGDAVWRFAWKAAVDGPLAVSTRFAARDRDIRARIGGRFHLPPQTVPLP